MNKSALQYARPIRKNLLALGTMVLLISSIPALGKCLAPVGALRPKRLLENLGLELTSQPETNAPDAAILQRRIGKAGPYRRALSHAHARSCSGEECGSRPP